MEFEEYTRRYDKLYTKGRYQRRCPPDLRHYKPLIQQIIKLKLIFTSLLDLGCANGIGIEHIKKLCPGVKVTGIDVNTYMVAEGKRLKRDVRQASATNLPFSDNSYELVISSDMFEHLAEEDVDIAIQESLRVSQKCLLLAICFKETKHDWKSKVGFDVHLTIKPCEWWLNKIRQYASWVTVLKDKTFPYSDIFFIKKS